MKDHAKNCVDPQIAPYQLGRRSFLAGMAATAGAAGSLLAVSAPAAVAAENFPLLRQRWTDLLTGASDIDPSDPRFTEGLQLVSERAEWAIGMIDRSGPGRLRVFTDISLSRPPASASETEKLAAINGIMDAYSRLRDMALAWATPGSTKYQNAAILQDIKDGLATCDAIAYNTTTTRWSNWWNFEIGIPRRISDIVVLLHAELSSTERQRYSDAITHYVPDPRLHDGQPWDAGNSISANSMAIVQALGTDDLSRLEISGLELPAACKLVAEDLVDMPGQGIWGDGSYILHSVPYAGVYGLNWLGDMSLMAALLPGTAYAVSNSGHFKNLYEAVDKAFLPVFHDGRFMSFVNGRMVANPTQQEHQLGIHFMTGALRLARSGEVDAATAQRWRERFLGAFHRSAVDPLLEASVVRVGLFSDLLDSGLPPAPEPDGSFVFRNSARAVHRRNGWAFGVAMNSNRIDRYESINGENLKGWHSGEGMTYLYDADQTQYTDMFWPTVDSQRLAGTTVDGRVLPAGKSANDGRVASPYSWAGGAAVDGYSTVGMSLHSGHTSSPITGKKSWFCFDEYIYCVGRNISGGGGNAVETIVENRNLHEGGTNALIVNGSVWTGADEEVHNPLWAHLEGVGGYVFPASGSPQVRLRREQRIGSWSQVMTSASTIAYSRSFLSLAIRHGANPTDGAYAYMVIPGATPERTQALSDHRDVSLLALNGTCHAVTQTGTGLKMFNFWESGVVDAVTVSRRCAVLVKEHSSDLTISVADPMRSNSTIRVEVAPGLSGYSVVSSDPAVTVISSGSTIIADVASGVYGQTRTLRLRR